MKTVTEAAAQGDVLFRRIAKLPEEAKEVPRKGALVVAHSETGHHHSIADKLTRHFETGNPLLCFLSFGDGQTGVDVVHHRPWDTHETLRLVGKPGDVWEVRRQREWSPEGWKRVED